LSHLLRLEALVAHGGHVTEVDEFWTAATAIGTIGAVVVALGVALLGPRRLAAPTLSVSIRMRPPDSHRVVSTMTYLPKSSLMQAPTYYCRLRISNDGNDEARDVEVQLLRLRRLGQDGSWTEDPVFLPLSLQWSHSREVMIVRPKLLPGLFRYCDLCHVEDPAGPFAAKSGDPWLVLNTEVEPNEFEPGSWPTKKPPGHYELDFAVAAANAKTVYRTARINFDGWFTEAEEMFDKGLHITLRDERQRRGWRQGIKIGGHRRHASDAQPVAGLDTVEKLG
jgi:hypothetical protein